MDFKYFPAKTCRTCLLTESITISLHDLNDVLMKKLISIYPKLLIEIPSQTTETASAKFICENCLISLKTSHAFQLKVEESERILWEKLGNRIATEPQHKPEPELVIIKAESCQLLNESLQTQEDYLKDSANPEFSESTFPISCNYISCRSDILSCPKCDFQTKHQKSLIIHYRKTHLQCHLCKYFTKKCFNLKRHYKSKHDIDEEFHNYHNLNDCKSIEKTAATFADRCNFKCKNQKELKRHHREKHLLQCHLCNYMSNQMFNLKVHYKVHHGIAYDNHVKYSTESFSNPPTDPPKTISTDKTGVGELNLETITIKAETVESDDCEWVEKNEIKSLEPTESTQDSQTEPYNEDTKLPSETKIVESDPIESNQNESKKIHTCPCSPCQYSSERRYDMARHINRKHSEYKKHEFGNVRERCKNYVRKIITCSVCQKNFNRSFNLKQHLKGKGCSLWLAKKDKNFGKLLACDHCGLKFASHKTRETHVKNVHLAKQQIHPENDVSSEIVTVPETKSVVLQPNSNDTEKSFNKVSSSQPDSVTVPSKVSVVDNTKQSNYVRKILTCSTCHKTFDRKYNLRIHFQRKKCSKWLALKDKGLACEFCKKLFMHRDTLTKHIKHCHLVENKRLWKCLICHKTKNQRNGLKAHFIKYHPEHEFTFESYEIVFASNESRVTDLPFKEQIFNCQRCSQTFLARTELRIHQKLTHNMAELFTCDICKKGFKSHPEIERHMMIHSNEHFILCPICGISFNKKVLYRVHMKKHH